MWWRLVLTDISFLQIWEVKFSRSGDFEKVARAFNLSGHTSGVYSFSFSADSSRVATVSKDGTWKVFNTDIEYTKGQDASVVISGNYDLDSSKPSKVAISPDGERKLFLTKHSLSTVLQVKW